MKLSEYKQDYYIFTGKLSDINRQIAFAGIALIWIFRKIDGSEISISNELILPSILFAFALGFDILQYIYQSITWSIFYNYHYKKIGDEETDIPTPKKLNYPSWFFFIMKVLFVIVSYTYIIKFLINNLVIK